MKRLLIGGILAILLAACASPSGTAQPADTARPFTPNAHPTLSPTIAPSPTATASPTATIPPTPTATPTPAYQTLRLAVDPILLASAPERIQALEALDWHRQGYEIILTEPSEEADLRLRLGPAGAMPAQGHTPLGNRFYVPVVPFDTIRDEIPLAELEARWRGEAPLLASEETARMLTALWGPGKPQIIPEAEMLAALRANREAVGIVPFEALEPTFKVLKPEGSNPLDRNLSYEEYPLALVAWLEGEKAAEIAPLLAPLWEGWANRDPNRMTQLIMTGVTAMCRLTADRMERYGTLYPARVISDVLRAADITHVSNEVPFVKGCPVNTAADNLTFCSDYDYWEALEAIGTDIVGLSGNHVNDYGYEGARESIAFYRQRGIPIYGSGLNEEEACAPLLIEHNGNRFAFLAALAFEPSYAWATEDRPGACYFYHNKERLLAKIAELKANPEVDIVSIELQYLETYNPYPTEQQVIEFRELREAGADIVTGVQSHVPQAWEPYDHTSGSPGIIVYGLGNLFFDQMWSWETRTGLIARHTIYQGRLINSEILTTVLEDYAQPRWATPEERQEILQRIFAAAPPISP